MQRAPKPGVLEPFKDEIHRLLREDPKLPGVRVRELLEPLGCRAGKTVVDDYLREVRPLFAPPRRTFQRTVYRPGEVCQFDVWEPRGGGPVGHGQTRHGWVVIACLGYSRAGAGVLVFSKQTEDLLAGIAGCLTAAGGVAAARWSGIARPASTATAGARRTRSPAFCGQLKVGWQFCEPADPQAKGAVERLQGYAETNFEPGRVFANELDFQDQLDALVREGQRAHAQDAARAPDRPAARRARAHGARCRASCPTPRGAGSRGSRPTPTCAWTPTTTRSTRAWSASASRSASASAGHGGRAGHRRARLPAHAGVRAPPARSPRSITPAPCATAARAPAETAVEVRPLARYDALIA